MSTTVGQTSSFTGASHAMIGDSVPMRELRASIDAVAPTRLPVLIYGPTGAGKELVASALHAHSRRRGAFVPFNVCAISDTMFEDALFGHVRGAFTGAMNDMPGFLREADGGSVFLDEVSGLPATLQVKLLRAMDNGVFRPVGASRDSRSDFRVLTATNERLEELIEAGRFRADFAHRIGAITMQVPSLAERREDIPLLVRHFLDVIGSAHVQVGDSAMEILSEYHWPGNVRELKHVIEWSAAFSNGHVRVDTLRAAMAQRSSLCGRATDRGAGERNEMVKLLERCAWDADAAAQQLGVHRTTFYRRIKRLGIRMRDVT